MRRVGKLTLNRNPDNFFAETEQVAYCVQNLVPGIDITNDPLMQARLFSYLDTQLTRLGGPNFAELPINRPVVTVHNHQQDGFGRQVVPAMRANYHPNSIDGGCPFLAGMQRGFVHHAQPLEGAKGRVRSDSFEDHFSQARMFLLSQSPAERQHLLEAFQFELAKVMRPSIRERVVQMFMNVDVEFALEIAGGLGLADVARRSWKPSNPAADTRPPSSPALSLANQPHTSIKSRCVAVLTADGADAADLGRIKAALASAGARAQLIAPHGGSLGAADGSIFPVEQTLLTAASVLYDAVYVAGGRSAVDQLVRRGDAVEFVRQAFRHGKTIAASGAGVALLAAAGLGVDGDPAPGVLVASDDTAASLPSAFIEAMHRHRHDERMEPRSA